MALLAVLRSFVVVSMGGATLYMSCDSIDNLMWDLHFNTVKVLLLV